MRTPGLKKKRHMRRQERKKRNKWFMAALLLILVPVGTTFLMRFINVNTVLEKSLTPHLTPGMTLSVERAFLGMTRYGLGIRMQNVKVYGTPKNVVFEAKKAAVAFDVWSALKGKVVPKALSATDVNITLSENKNGALQFDVFPKANHLSAPPFLATDKNHSSSFRDVFPFKESSSPETPLPFSAQVYDSLDVLLSTGGFLGDLDHVNLRRVHVIRNERKNADQKEESITLLDKGRLTLSRPQRKTPDIPRSMLLTLEGPEDETPWSIFADFRTSSEESVDVRMTFENAPFFKFAEWGGARLPFMTLDVPFSGTLFLEQTLKNLKNLSLSLSSEKGMLLIDDPIVPKVPINHAQFSAVWDPESDELVIPSLKFDVGPNRFAFSGQARFFAPKDRTSPQWDFSLVSPKTTFKGLTPEDMPLSLTTLSLSGSVFSEGRFKSEFVAKGEKIDIALSGEASSEEAPRVILHLGVKKTDARHFLRLWPVVVAPNTHHYLSLNLKEGTVDLAGVVSLEGKDLEQITKKNGILSEEAINLDVEVQDGILTPAPHVPTLYNLKVKGKVTGQRATFQVPQARMVLKDNAKKQSSFSFDLSDGGLHIVDFYTTPQAHINFRTLSSVEAVIAFLKTPLIALENRAMLDSLHVSSGDSDLKVNLTLPLEDEIARKDVRVSGQGVLKNVTVGGVYGKEDYSKATFSVDLKNKESLILEGKGQIFGLNTDLRLGVGEVEKPGLVLSTLVTDDVRRNKGWASRDLRGPLKVSMDVPLTEGKVPFVSIDLTASEILNFVPGWIKAGGQPASLTFSLRDHTLENFSLTSKTFSAEGKGTLSGGDSPTVASLDLKSIQWSKGDSLSALWTRTPEGSHTQIKGSFLNATPLIPALGNLTQEGGKSSFSLDAAIARVTGFHSEAFTNFTALVTQRQGKMTQFKLGAYFSEAKGREKRGVTGSLLPLTTGDKDILLLSNNAGAFLRFLGIYRDMENGDLEFRVDTNVQPSVGRLSIRDFFIINNSFRVPDSKAESQKPLEGVDHFSKLIAQFVFGPEVVVRNGLILGPTSGIAIEGKINVKTRSLSLFGTYVPAYALNNTFANIPLIGPILGGGRHEGLFAVSFQVTGPFEHPKTMINPLSALTPGLLRKFFDISR